MTPNTLHSFLLPACKPLFPEHLMDSNAQAMMLTIGLQESDLKHRQQLIGRNRNWWQSINGPATGFWQFEKIGIKGVIEHRTAGPMFKTVCDLLGYPTNVNVIHKAVINNDILAVALARCLLWMVPEKLPALVRQQKPGINICQRGAQGSLAHCVGKIAIFWHGILLMVRALAFLTKSG